jgi:hypothetical protein
MRVHQQKDPIGPCTEATQSSPHLLHEGNFGSRNAIHVVHSTEYNL